MFKVELSAAKPKRFWWQRNIQAGLPGIGLAGNVHRRARGSGAWV